jgi:hypothetical protein
MGRRKVDKMKRTSIGGDLIRKVFMMATITTSLENYRYFCSKHLHTPFETTLYGSLTHTD